MGTGPRSEDQASLPAWLPGAQPRSQGPAPTEASQWQLLQSPPTNGLVLQRRWESSSGLVSLMEVTLLPSVQASLSREQGGDTLGNSRVEVLVLAGLATTSKKNDNMI